MSESKPHNREPRRAVYGQAIIRLQQGTSARTIVRFRSGAWIVPSEFLPEMVIFGIIGGHVARVMAAIPGQGAVTSRPILPGLGSLLWCLPRNCPCAR